MTAVTPNVNAVQASTFLEGATDVTLRQRALIGWFDKAGRINRDCKGKDWNWKLRYKSPTAQQYQAYQTLNFANDNYWLPAVVTPEWFNTTSGMDITEILTNSGPSMVVNSYANRVKFLAEAMEIYLAKSLYMDAAGSGSGRPAGLATVVQGSTTIACTNGDRIRAPQGTYAGLAMALGSQGGSWSNLITGLPAGSEFPMNIALATDWPDGQGDASQMYDGTSPRLYNECSNRWNDPATLIGALANSSWRTNCVAMLSRANTDLRQNTVESMMPNIHISASQRHQDIKDKMREAFRDIAAHGPSVDLGYHSTLEFEGAAIIQDHECPGDRTYSLCAESMELDLYSGADGAKLIAAEGMDNSRLVTGGIYMLFGPQQIPGTLVTGWILFAGGQTRFSPKWVVCHKNWTY